MSDNRVAMLPDTEDGAHETLLAQLARAHGAESRAADVVAAECLHNHFRYTPALGWIEWTGQRWDTDAEADEKVIETVRAFMDGKERDFRARYVAAGERLKTVTTAVTDRLDPEEAAKLRMLKKDHEIVDEHGTDAETTEYNAAFREAQTSKQQADIWLNLLSNAKIRSVTNLCRGMEGIRTRTTDLDNHPTMLNCTNLVVDLSTGETQPHNPDLLITHLAGGAYLPGARSPLWDKALKAVEPNVLGWFQKRMGQSFTGNPPADDSLVVSAGGGENGKSAVMDACLRAAGTYGDVISHRVLIGGGQNHPTELMDLRGMRLAVLEETPEEGRLDTQQLKTTVGTAKIKARHMRKDSVTFVASHTLWINTNFIPQVDSTDHGTWRRLFAMPWPFTFRKPWEQCTEPNHREGDLTLKPALKTDPGVPDAVIAWVVRGAVALHSDIEHQQPPAAIVEAAAAWRATSDVGFQFATERLVAATDHFITSEALYSEFTEFLAAEGKRAWSKQTINTRFPESLKAAGINVDKTPQDKPKVRQDDKQSHRPVSDEAWTTSRPGDVAAGRAIRMWRGVRFRTPAEIGQSLHEAA